MRAYRERRTDGLPYRTLGNFGRNRARRLQANERDERTAQALVDVFKAKHPEEAAFADEVVRKLGLA
jgi:hypothetical protein